MKGIGGNTKAILQVSTVSRNDIGETVNTWTDAQTINGWLDLISGEARYQTYYSKIQESTHVFMADFVQLDPRITAEHARAVIDGKPYDITLIDNPMGLDAQLEIYLKFTGGM